MALTRLAHQLIKEHFESSGANRGLAVDATCGNGFDTEFLCRLGFKQVIGFDIQARAIEITRHRLESAGYMDAALHPISHTQISDLVTQAVDCAMFNFGYLPHGDKTITTMADSSITAIEAVLVGLSAAGIVSLLCYPGHEAGRIETNAIQSFLNTLDDKWRIQTHRSRIASQNAPILFTLSRAPASGVHDRAR